MKSGLSKYKDKLFSVLGDSVSTLEGISEPADAAFYSGINRIEAGVFGYTDTWWGKVIERLGGRLLVNNSFQGSTVIKHRLCEIPSYACSDERTSALSADGKSPDLILVFMGMNDWGCGARVTSDGEDEDPAFFSVAYRRMLTRLSENYPEARTVCLTLPVTAKRGDAAFTFPYRHGGRHIEEYNAVIRARAAEFSCLTADIYNPDAPIEAFDGFHPTADGMNAIADAVIKAMLSDE